MNSEVSSLRQEYLQSSLDEKDVHTNPLIQFDKWFKEALKSEILEPNAMVLGTTDASGQPFQRTLLIKDYSEAGFTFYTNYESTKGNQMANNPSISILFPWYELQRQVIVRGTVEKTSKEQSEDYFHSRPIGSQLGAVASKQSQRLQSREELESNLEEAKRNFEGKTIPLPDNWGGYLLQPSAIEFWQGRASRLHDRILYEKQGESWLISRLSP